MQTHSGAYLKNHSRNLHAPLCSIFSPNPTKKESCRTISKMILSEAFFFCINKLQMP
ncbi:DUF6783 domain-containing protein [Blautia faecis]|uniref:DUF6783 domain-containing protein n=1 Tax=Blautia TaxID=572511 RepID=UPI003A7F5DC6